MKIAFLTSEYPHPKTNSSGGIGTSIKNLAETLVKLDCKVMVLVYGQDKDEQFTDNGIVIKKIKNVKFKGLSWWLTAKKIEKTINVLVDENKIDLVEVPDWTGISSFINVKCPLVMKLHGSDTYFCHLDKRPVKWWNKFQEKRAYKNATAIVAVSDFVGKMSNKLFGIERKYVVIPNGINVDKFVSKSIKSENIILYFGTIIRKKGVLELPLIFNKVVESNQEVKLVIIGRDTSDIITGSNSTWELVQSLFSEKAKKNVEYKGSISYDNINEEIEKSAVCVFPSFAEAFPVSWLEAMAMQKPIVASNIGWANEMIDNNLNGVLVSPIDHFVFAQKIINLLENKELQAKMGLNARMKAEQNFSNLVIAKRNIEFYKKLTV
ncbi:MAG: glycosyltransferase family 4 protein [Flavobacterium sp.]|uniref:glycosyltransferase family 4 protein n=1 Tax=Flavobacterium sp. TaxID=239 RepID=UPI0022C05AE8|nr:glycosyltransferase family 4 protein [Flavobacterium sp.]MCZ8197287.1 glycosyltransferase family 4 protein [Flavobacterium sp.]